MTFSQAEFIRDLTQAANDLGYDVDSLDWSGRVTLVPSKGHHRQRITLEGIFLSGDYIRATLRPIVTDPES